MAWNLREFTVSLANHLPVVEIFYTLRGEGHWAGSAATFIRLGTCNLACPGCDTEFDRFVWTPFSEVDRFIRSTKCPWVVFTGGEPLLHDRKISEFQEWVATQGYTYEWHLETNGTREIQESDWSWITCSPKLGFSGKGPRGSRANWTAPENLSASLLTEANEFKMITSRTWSMPLTEQMPWLRMQNDSAELFAQPWREAVYDANLHDAIEFCLANPEVRLSLQTHKYIGVR